MQREISVSEFFAKNRHLLGFDNPRRALLTTVKEAVDNALDACEEAGILPELTVRIEHLPQIDESRYLVTVQDNGPGVVRRQIDNIFGKLLYGSKFHRLKMSRGQQGIGISAAGMYGLMTTGRPMIITTRSKKGQKAHHVELAMDTTKNKPEVSVDEETDDFPQHTGTRVVIELEGKHQRGRGSVDAYIEQTAIANPHALLMYIPPTRSAADEAAVEPLLESESESGPEVEIPEALEHTTTIGDTIIYPRTIGELPPEPEEIKPHPKGVELGTLMRMCKQTSQKQLGGFLTKEFCRVSPKASQEICELAGLTTRTWVSTVGHAEAEALHKAIQNVKLMGPPLNCLAPIGTRQILAGLLKGVRAEFYTAATRPPSVYRGNPFQIEAGIAFGGDLKAEETARVIRFANRVPLLYQQSACSAFKAFVETSWKNYGLTQPRSSAPQGPLVVMIHMASVWVPFTSESKEAIADYDEIRKEMKLALQECGRKLGSYVRKRERIRREGQRRDAFARYIGEVARALHTIDPGLDPAKVRDDLEAVAASRTEYADVTLDEDGMPIEPVITGRADDDTIILDSSVGNPPASAPTAMKPEAAQRPSNKKKARSNAGKPAAGGSATKKRQPTKKKASRRPSSGAQAGLFGE
ncbi:MAG: DNA topoisomerase VI subunit B [Phycisphaeraceae bacterium]|nr:DNA topoisomerase VI subunit B [Phycisphaeraceae bacterium]